MKQFPEWFDLAEGLRVDFNDPFHYAVDLPNVGGMTVYVDVVLEKALEELKLPQGAISTIMKRIRKPAGAESLVPIKVPHASNYEA